MVVIRTLRRRVLAVEGSRRWGRVETDFGTCDTEPEEVCRYRRSSGGTVEAQKTCLAHRR